MAEREDLRPGVAAADERIVGRHRSVVLEAQHLAGEAHAVLRRRTGGIGVADGRVAVADRHVDVAVLAECDSRRVARWNRREEILRLDERGAVPARARERDDASRRSRPAPTRGSGDQAAGAGHLRLVIGEVHQLVLGELRMERDVHQASQAGGLHLRQAGDGRRIEHAVADDPQPTGALRDQDAAVGQKRHAPGLVETFGHDETNLVLDRRVHHDRSVRQRRRGPVDRRRRRRRASRAPASRCGRRRLTASSARGLLRVADGHDDTCQRRDRAEP